MITQQWKSRTFSSTGVPLVRLLTSVRVVQNIVFMIHLVPESSSLTFWGWDLPRMLTHNSCPASARCLLQWVTLGSSGSGAVTSQAFPLPQSSDGPSCGGVVEQGGGGDAHHSCSVTREAKSWLHATFSCSNCIWRYSPDGRKAS